MTRDQYPIVAIIATDYCHLRVVTTARSLLFLCISGGDGGQLAAGARLFPLNLNGTEDLMHTEMRLLVP